MRQPRLFFLLIILFTCLSFQCNTSFQTFDKTGGVLYTFQLSKNATLDDVEQIKSVFSSRIATYVKQKPKFIYDETTQQFSVGVPKSLTSKSADFTKKLLLAKGTFRVIPQYEKTLKPVLDEINLKMQEQALVFASGDFEEILEDSLYSMLKLELPSTVNYNYGFADYHDTAMVSAILAHGDFLPIFEKHSNLVWAWKDEAHMDKASLHAFDKTQWASGVTEEMITTCKLEKSSYGEFLLNIKLDDKGKEIFEKQTIKAASTKAQLHIFVGKNLIMSPVVQEPITGGRVQITTGDRDIELMFFLQAVITSGRLPFKMKLLREEII